MLRRAVVLSALVLAVACEGATDPRSRIMASLVAASPDSQVVATGEVTVKVRALDANGDPVEGQPVVFRVVSGGGSVFTGSTVTDAGGHASERWTLGSDPAALQEVEARATAAGGEGAVFNAVFRVATGAPASVIVDSGWPASTPVDSELPITIRVTDAFGNTIGGIGVSFSSVGSETAAIYALDGGLTDAQGRLRALWYPGVQAGNATIRISAGTVTSTATTTVTPGGVTSMVRTHDAERTASPGSNIGAGVQLKDRYGNPVPGETVSFQVIAGAGSVAPAVITDAQGRASTSWVLDTYPGENEVLASVKGMTTAFRAVGQRLSPHIDLVPQSPAAGSSVGDTVSVEVYFSAAWGEQWIYAYHGSRSVELLRQQGCCGRYAGKLDLTGLPAGPITVVITGADRNGGVEDAFLRIVRNVQGGSSSNTSR